MKPKIMMVIIAGMILNISNPALAQGINSDSLSGDGEIYPPITIPWQYTSVFETNAGNIMQQSMIYDLPLDSADYILPKTPENIREDDNCEEMKTDLSSTCTSDYKFINEPVTIQ